MLGSPSCVFFPFGIFNSQVLTVRIGSFLLPLNKCFWLCVCVCVHFIQLSNCYLGESLSDKSQSFLARRDILFGTILDSSLSHTCWLNLSSMRNLPTSYHLYCHNSSPSHLYSHPITTTTSSLLTLFELLLAVTYFQHRRLHDLLKTSITPQ